jgi:hypothetical protein
MAHITTPSAITTCDCNLDGGRCRGDEARKREVEHLSRHAECHWLALVWRQDAMANSCGYPLQGPPKAAVTTPSPANTGRRFSESTPELTHNVLAGLSPYGQSFDPDSPPDSRFGADPQFPNDRVSASSATNARSATSRAHPEPVGEPELGPEAWRRRRPGRLPVNSRTVISSPGGANDPVRLPGQWVTTTGGECLSRRPAAHSSSCRASRTDDLSPGCLPRGQLDRSPVGLGVRNSSSRVSSAAAGSGTELSGSTTRVAGPALPLDPPDPADEPVDQEGRPVEAVDRPAPAGVAGEVTAVGVGEQEVVVLGRTGPAPGSGLGRGPRGDRGARGRSRRGRDAGEGGGGRPPRGGGSGRTRP